MEPMVALVFVKHTNIVGVDCPTAERIRVEPEAKHFLPFETTTQANSLQIE